MRRYQTKTAFTLVELLLYMAIVSFLSIIVVGLIISISGQYLAMRDRSQLLSDTREVVRAIDNDIYRADSLTITPSGQLILHYNHNALPDVTYYLDNGRVYRSSNGVNSVLTHAENTVNILTFVNLTDPATADLIEMTINISSPDFGPVRPGTSEQITSSFVIRYK